MKTFSVVLGLGFGDEGKGRTVDFLCSRPLSLNKKIVVRFSGGSQAGHTVMVGNTKHIHSSFGSGSLRGYDTYLSEHVVLNPVTAVSEGNVLKDKGFYPKLYIHPLTLISTPMDVLYNKKNAEQLQHGTCGLGIGNTIQRDEEMYKLRAIDLLYPSVCKEKLESIYCYYRGKGLQMPSFDTVYDIFSMNVTTLLRYFVADIVDYSGLNRFNHVIFEGSQGIMLDQSHGIFPNVTRSNTTSKNALEIIDQIGQCGDIVETYYVTRAYQTRHGNGWMSNEGDVTLANTEEEINVTNQFQGVFRTGKLDVNLLNYAFDIDSLYNKESNKYLMVTCVDQVGKDPDLSGLFNKFKTIYYFWSPEN